MTLDWTSSALDEEKNDKRWMLSRAKWKDKDKIVPLGVLVDQQEQFYKGTFFILAREKSQIRLFYREVAENQVGG